MTSITQSPGRPWTLDTLPSGMVNSNSSRSIISYPYSCFIPVCLRVSFSLRPATPREITEKREPLPSQKDRSHQETNQPAPRTSRGLTEQGEINVCCLSYLVCCVCYSSPNWLRCSPVVNLVWEARARGLQKVNLPVEKGHYWANKQNYGQSVLKNHLKSSSFHH